MSEETTKDKPESISKVLMDYFRDYEMMKANKLPWPTPEYLLRLLKRVFKASTAERSAMLNTVQEIDRIVWDKKRHTKEEVEAHRLATEALTAIAADTESQTRTLAPTTNKQEK